MSKIEYLDTNTYDAGDGFLVDIVDNTRDDLREVWLYHEEYGVKMFVFGFQEDLEYALEITEKTINDHKATYKDKYMDEEL